MASLGSANVEFGAMTGDDVLSLVAARLNDKALVDGLLSLGYRHVSWADLTRIDGLPSTLLGLERLVTANLHHVVDDSAALVASRLGVVPISLLLRHHPHGQLADVDGVVRVVAAVVLVDQVEIQIVHHVVVLFVGLDRPEPASRLRTISRIYIVLLAVSSALS